MPLALKPKEAQINKNESKFKEVQVNCIYTWDDVSSFVYAIQFNFIPKDRRLNSPQFPIPILKVPHSNVIQVIFQYHNVPSSVSWECNTEIYTMP